MRRGHEQAVRGQHAAHAAAARVRDQLAQVGAQQRLAAEDGEPAAAEVGELVDDGVPRLPS